MSRQMLLLLCLLPAIGCGGPKVDRSGTKRSKHTTSKPAVKGVWPGRFPVKVLYMVRHGSTVFNRYSQIGGHLSYDPLDALGFKERVGIFLLLRGEPIAAVYTSMQRRSRMTAAPLAAHHKLEIRPTPALNEFAGGVSEGICYSLLGKKPSTEEAVACDQTSDDPLVKRAEAFLRQENKRRFKVGIHYRWPGGGESIPDVDKRLDKWLRTLPPDLENKTVAFIGHSGTNRFLLAKLMGWPLLNAARVRQDHTQVWRIERKGPGKLELKIYIHGQWVLCAEPPTLRKGLPCLRRHHRPPPRPAPAETRVNDVDKPGTPAPGGAKPGGKSAGAKGGAKTGAMTPAPEGPRPAESKLRKRPFK